MIKKLLTLVLLVATCNCRTFAVEGTEVNQSAKFSHTRSETGFIKGYTWGYPCGRGAYQGDGPVDSMKKLASIGANYICIAFGAEMNSPNDPQIFWAEPDANIVTDAEIRHAIELARKNNLKVILKPMVNIRDGTWRAEINFKTADGKTDTQTWDKWWANYGRFLLHYAKIAQETKCELFCLGCEMSSTERFVEQWRGLIAEVRKVYSGPITYNANHDNESKVKWWDAVDVIGMSGYYSVGIDPPPRDPNAAKPKPDTSVEAMKKRWQPVKQKLKYVSRQFDKPVVFLEIGVCSAKDFAAAPWTHPQKDATYDGDEQARFYQAVMETFWDEPWFFGFVWWDWPVNLYTTEEAKTDTGFCIYGKPTEQIVRQWYAKPR
ncbi:MAG: glycosyl hydrolase family 53 [Sedimentisphaerales bacterium]